MHLRVRELASPLDGRMDMRVLLYGVPCVLPLVIVGGALAGGVGYWAGPIVAFVLLPLCDELSHWCRRQVALDEPRRQPQPRTLRFVPALFVPIEFGFLLWAADLAGSAELNPGEWLGLIAGTGVLTGAVGITYAHELIHSQGKLERRLGEGLLLMVGYMHFAIEHVEGHHVNAATPHDPASAPREMSIYQFIPRSVLHTVRHAWAIERRRLARLGRPIVGIRNRMLWYVLLPLGFGTVVALAYGRSGLGLFAGQACVAVCLLEVINYLQHYGLARRHRDGRLERLQAHHSWDSDRRLSSALLLNLPRHSDHHLHVGRRYASLQLREDAPKLPAGYPAMMLLAMVPPLFFAVMRRRLDALVG